MGEEGEQEGETTHYLSTVFPQHHSKEEELKNMLP